MEMKYLEWFHGNFAHAIDGVVYFQYFWALYYDFFWNGNRRSSLYDYWPEVLSHHTPARPHAVPGVLNNSAGHRGHSGIPHRRAGATVMRPAWLAADIFALEGRLER